MTVGARLSQPRVRDPGHYPVGVINKTDLAPLVRADLGVMERDSRRMRGDGPFVFAQVLHDVGVRDVADHLLAAWRAATNVATGV